MRLPEGLLSSAEANSLSTKDLLKWCATTGMTAIDASNALALQIAREYVAGGLNYVFCDRVMNALIGAVTTKEFFAVSDSSVPQDLLQVYLAFDAGEYVHDSDMPDEIPEEKYTRPTVLALLRRSNSEA